MRKFFTDLINFFFPPICPLCRRLINDNKIICEDCFEDIARLLVKEPLCLKCGKTKKHAHICKKTFLFDEIVTLFYYRDKVAKLIHFYKYNRRKKFANLLLNFLKNRVQYLKDGYDFILSVPLHPARKRERGFDQNEVFCREISKSLDIPYVKNLIYRIRYTKPQAGLKKEKREKNIKNAFIIYGNLRGKKIILFDDVITTGATLNELSALLKEKGVEKITALTLAIA